MASRKVQAIPATNAKNKSVLTASGVTSDIITRSKARALSYINSTNGASAPEARARDHLSLVKSTNGGSSNKYSDSMLSDVDSSSSSAMKVMTTGATSINEQLAQMNEAIARLTRTMEEKDLQIPKQPTGGT
ncbi:hypothetical protein ACFX1W_032349 [Malus domestica]